MPLTLEFAILMSFLEGLLGLEEQIRSPPAPASGRTHSDVTSALGVDDVSKHPVESRTDRPSAQAQAEADSETRPEQRQQSPAGHSCSRFRSDARRHLATDVEKQHKITQLRHLYKSFTQLVQASRRAARERSLLAAQHRTQVDRVAATASVLELPVDKDGAAVSIVVPTPTGPTVHKRKSTQERQRSEGFFGSLRRKITPRGGRRGGAAGQANAEGLEDSSTGHSRRNCARSSSSRSDARVDGLLRDQAQRDVALVETIRLIAEIVIWGEKRDGGEFLFEYFCETGLLSDFVRVLIKRRRTSKPCQLPDSRS